MTKRTPAAPRRSGLPRRSRRRLFAVLGCFSVAFGAIGVRLVSVQGFDGAQLAQASAHQSVASITLPALRGSILASDGDELALSEMRKTIFADPLEVTNAAAEAAALAPLLHQTPAALRAELTAHTTYVPLATGLTESAASAVEAKALAGIGTEDDPVRFHPASPLAAPLLGYLNDNGAVSGLELEYDRYLTGRNGHLVESVDPSGHPVPGSVTRDVPAVDGNDLLTTIDEPLQYQAEEALAKAITQSHGTGGTAVVEDTRTGALLAVASLAANGNGGPPSQAPSATAFTSVYEPGSVAKIVTVAGGLADGVISPGSVFTIPNSYDAGGSVFHDAEVHPTYQLSVTGILAQSSNIGAIQIAQRMGPTALYREEQAFGLTRRSAVDFPGESSGLITPLSQFSGTTLPTLAFGEADAQTAVQMAGAMNTIANGGVYVPARLASGVVGPTGRLSRFPAGPTHRVVPGWVASDVTGMLEQVVAGGTGSSAQVPGYAVAGKTGTAYALKPTGGYDYSRYVSSFAGFAPAEHPAVTIIVVVDHTVLYGAEAAAPAFATIARDALLDLGVPSGGPQPAARPTANPIPLG